VDEGAMIKKYKPTSSGRRQGTFIVSKELSRGKSHPSLTFGRKKSVGRSGGKVTVRHKGAGVKRLYRIIDFGQSKRNIPGKIDRIEYDPNRSAWIALVKYPDGDFRYYIAPAGLKAGDKIEIGEDVSSDPGNRLPLGKIPVGTQVFNIEITSGRGGQLVRSAGNLAKIVAKDDKYVDIELPSKEVRKILKICYATVGTISNPEHINITIGKAGRKRLMGIRPTVRGKAMSPRSHPHGGGEGVNPIGLPHPKTPWGKPALGYKTRKKQKYSDKFIVKGRKR
jgi:large subunit ribosomal protein L2